MNSKFNVIDPNQSNVSDLAVITKVTSEEDRLPEDEHKKAANAFLLSDSIASGIARDFAFVKQIPQYIKEIIDNKLWECLYVAKGVVTPYYCRYTKGTDSENFRAFITAKRPNGLETSIDEIDNILNSNPEVQRQFRTLIYESRQGERTDLDEDTTSYSDYNKLDDSIGKIQQARIRAANRAAEAIPIIGELLDLKLISIDVAAKLGRDIKDPDNLTADEREYIENRDLIGYRINQYFYSNPIPEDEYKEPAYGRKLNRYVKDLLGIKDRSKSVRMDHPKKAADKLLQFYQGEKLKTLIDYLQRGLSELKDLSKETPSEIVLDTLSNKFNENGQLPQPDKSTQAEEETTEELEIESNTSDLTTNNPDSPETPKSTVVDDSSTSKSQEDDSSEQTTKDSDEISESVSSSSEDVEEMRLTSSELAKRLRLKTRSLINAVTKYKDDFPEWTSKKDPDGIAWQKSDEKRGRSPLYVPLKPKNA